jgi:CRISPR-associated protein Cas2
MAAPIYVVCYDIAHDRGRRRVAELLGDRLIRVQESVFEGRVEEDDIRRLLNKAARHMLPGDSLRAYCVMPEGLARSHALGGQPLPEPSDFMLF